MKEKQARHYQCEMDALVAQQQRMEAKHEEDLARLAREQSAKVGEIKAHYESQVAEREGEIEVLTREFERQSEHLHHEIFRMEERVQTTLSLARDMEHDINVLRNKNKALRARHAREKEDLEEQLKSTLDANEALEAKIDGLERNQAKGQAELTFFLDELSALSTAELLPSFDSQVQ